MGFYDSNFDFNNDGILDGYEEACEDYNYDELFGSSDAHNYSHEYMSGDTYASPGFRRACERNGINLGKTSKEHWQAFDELLRITGEEIDELLKRQNERKSKTD